jgi:hypothetical protein
MRWEISYMGYEDLEMDTLVTLETVLSRAAKVEKNLQFKKDIEYEKKRVLKAMGK